MIELSFSKQVQAAMANSLPIVALESTIITHGMPYPNNYRIATKVESIVKANGAAPATIAIVDGVIKVGLEDHELKRLAQSGQSCSKISRRDIAIALTCGLTGGTTVSATMLIAHRAGIKIFATGGIGGVHRNVENSMDISTDLIELGRTPVIVFSSGIKSILDIGKTLEMLETLGVTVATLDLELKFSDQETQFPAFFSRKSGFKSPKSFNCIEQVSQFIKVHLDLNLKSGILVGVPVPSDKEISSETVEPSILAALKEAEAKGIVGKDITPFLLSKVNRLTKGQSLEANMALICNNAMVASQVAVQLKSLSGPKIGLNSGNFVPIVVGALVMDHLVKSSDKNLEMDGYTHPGTVELSAGGVGRNIGDALTRLGHNPLFITCIGDDRIGEIVKKDCNHMDTRGFFTTQKVSTPIISVLVNGVGETLAQIGGTEAVNSLDPEKINRFSGEIRKSPIMVLDLNLSIDTLIHILSLCCEAGIPVWIEPTDLSVVKKLALIPTKLKKCIVFLSPNIIELKAIIEDSLWRPLKNIISSLNSNQFVSTSGSSSKIKQLMEFYLFKKILSKIGVSNLLVTLGDAGLLLVSEYALDSRVKLGPGLKFGNELKLDRILAHHIPAHHIDPDRIVSSSGAGDCLVAGIVAGFLRKKTLIESLKLGQECAILSLQSSRAVPLDLHSLAYEPVESTLKSKL